ncbi:hypothetical protein [Ralstonia solanacearum]|uniref:hypothetical protein n=1 Tax=Ralstonia solanacearum TaxID=305 RepID=UPI001FFDAC55|nr:hypothetical protein [Ralstonia solanacearum]
MWKKFLVAMGEEGAEFSRRRHESSEVASRMVMARLGNACRKLSGADVPKNLWRQFEELLPNFV